LVSYCEEMVSPEVHALPRRDRCLRDVIDPLYRLWVPCPSPGGELLVAEGEAAEARRGLLAMNGCV